MAKSQNKRYEAESIWAFVDNLRREAGFKSEGEFATAAGFLPSSLSDWKRGEHVVSSYNLVRLITAAAEKRATSHFVAGEAVSPSMTILRRLGELEAVVAERPTRQELHEGLETLREAIHRVANQGTGEDQQQRKTQVAQ